MENSYNLPQTNPMNNYLNLIYVNLGFLAQITVMMYFKSALEIKEIAEVKEVKQEGLKVLGTIDLTPVVF